MPYSRNGADTASPVRALHSLTERHVTALSEALPHLAGQWVLDRHEGYDGDLTLLLSSPDAPAAHFVISRKASLFHLAATTGDEYRQIGDFAQLSELVPCVQARSPPKDPTDRDF